MMQVPHSDGVPHLFQETKALQVGLALWEPFPNEAFFRIPHSFLGEFPGEYRAPSQWIFMIYVTGIRADVVDAIGGDDHTDGSIVCHDDFISRLAVLFTKGNSHRSGFLSSI